MRPAASTPVASTNSRPAPDIDSDPRWIMCQSFMVPSVAEYWHMGATTRRLGSSRLPMRVGEKSIDMGNGLQEGRGWEKGEDRGHGIGSAAR